MDRRLGAVLVAGLAVLGGCSATGLVGPGSTPTPEPPYVAAPGIDADGVEDASQLAAAHRASLEGVSYTLRTGVVIRRPDGSVRATRTTVVRVGRGGPHGRPFTLEQRAAGPFPEAIATQANFSAWSSGGHTFVRIEPGARQSRYTRYDGGVSDAIVVLDGDEAIDIYVAPLSNASVVETSADGWIAYRLESTAPSGRHTVAVVDSFGLLRSLSVRTPAEDVFWIRDPGTVVRTLRYERIGNTTVERPDWVDDAIVATADDRESD